MIFLGFLLMISSLTTAEPQAQFIDAQHGLALKILKSQENVNLIYSPFSIYAGFGMAYNGALGQTKSEIHEKALNSVSPDEIDTQFKKATDAYCTNTTGYVLRPVFRVYCEKSYPVFENFTNKLESTYNSSVLSVDFANQASTVRKQINSWVEKKTKDKIKNLIPEGSLDSMTKLMLVNALYFKGSWETQFRNESTKAENIFSSPTKNNTVDMMHSFGEDNYLYYENAELQVLGLPYIEDKLKLAMFIILPKERFGLNTLERKFKSNVWTLMSQAQTTKMADVKIPKFKIEKLIDLKATFKSYGIQKMFNSKEADFSAIGGQRNLFVTNIYHKAYIQVTEFGTEAAAATMISASMAMMPRLNFIADHPFLFTIVDRETYFPLFYGRFVGP